MPKGAELLVTPGHDGVRAARRLTSATLQSLPEPLAADAELVVAELVTNAVLHGAPPISLRLRGRCGRVRIEVEDAVQAGPLRGWRGEGMTGRGLEVVDSLSYAWGVRLTDSGKLVWAELGRPRRSAARRAAASAADLSGSELLASGTERHYEVRLGWVPTELLLAAKIHIDNVVRELVLMRSPAADEVGLPAETVQRLARVTQDFTEARREIKSQAVAAARRGDVFTDLVLTLPLSAAEAGLRYLAALDEADQQARDARLLTVAAPPSHRVFREWYVREIVAQLQAVARDDPPPRTTQFSLVLAAELDRLAEHSRDDR
ncbi:MAG TPA: ATP-binding protein [Mycobacteriales bacterium]|jgi:hypothetical protein|nr:ATP-binding protein [Mycobacteriales bacterium]